MPRDAAMHDVAATLPRRRLSPEDTFFTATAGRRPADIMPCVAMSNVRSRGFTFQQAAGAPPRAIRRLRASKNAFSFRLRSISRRTAPIAMLTTSGAYDTPPRQGMPISAGARCLSFSYAPRAERCYFALGAFHVMPSPLF